MLQKYTVNQVTELIIGAAIEVHRQLGPGMLESTYEVCTHYELQRIPLFVERQKSLPIVYKGIQLDEGYRMDLLVENLVVVELKAVERLTDVHTAQILSYMSLSGCEVDLLINFKVKMLKDGGIRRFKLA